MVWRCSENLHERYYHHQRKGEGMHEIKFICCVRQYDFVVVIVGLCCLCYTIIIKLKKYQTWFLFHKICYYMHSNVFIKIRYLWCVCIHWLIQSKTVVLICMMDSFFKIYVLKIMSNNDFEVLQFCIRTFFPMWYLPKTRK